MREKKEGVVTKPELFYDIETEEGTFTAPETGIYVMSSMEGVRRMVLYGDSLIPEEEYNKMMALKKVFGDLGE